MPAKTSANIGFEEKLWAAADKMRNNIDPSEYKHVVLGLIFLKYISDSFETLHQKLMDEEGQEEVEDKDYYTAENVFWVPKEARWSYIRDNAKKEEIGKIIDNAMIAIEKENPKLRGVLEKNYARPHLDKRRLGELVDIISGIDLVDRRHRELTDGDIQTISNTYHNWRIINGQYEDKKGFCKAAKLEEVEKNGYVLTPGRYVGTEIVEKDDEVFEEKMKRLTTELNLQFEQSKELERRIKENPGKLI